MSAYWSGRKVLVAGGTGTIGVPTVGLLRSRGADVTVIAVDSMERAREVLGADVEYRRLDLTTLANCLEATKGFQDVFNLVGIKGSVGVGESKVASFFYAMSLFQTNLMEAAYRNSVERFMFVSSICAYPRSAVPKAEDTVWDGMPLQNDRIPGLVKRIGEVQAETYKLQHGWEGVRIVRPANVYGPLDDFDPATAQVVPALIRRMLAGESPLKVWGDGSVVRDFVFSEDVAYWTVEAMEKAPGGLPINIGSGEATTIRGLVTTLCSLVPVAPEVIWDPSGPTGDPVRLLDVTRAREILDYRTRTPLKEGLRRTMAWLSSQPEGALARKKPLYG
ncbi:MAG: NAD-dependent epimerase/dehydratase family protein [Alphaproteobacteria bacterium]